MIVRDRDGRKDGRGGSGGGRDAAPEEDDMSTSLLDIDTSKLYAQVRDTGHVPW